MKDQILHLLAENYPTFDRELQEIISSSGSVKSYKAGEQIIRPGQYFQYSMLIAKGRVKLYREGDDGNEFFMYFLDPGSACALSMICATKHEKSQMLAEAIEDTDVIAIPLELMDNLMKNYRSWYYFVLETYRNRFEELLQVIDHIAFKSMDERLEYYLLNQAEKLDTRNLQLTHQQIANDLNSSREVISRLLKNMEKSGKLTLLRNAIQLSPSFKPL
ncbi:MAG: Crp/Fnr family transcriptional regulator [Cyclobacteriaceae bacterium]|jgi:CRP/FNR family transcriptional regulator|nr:Crp/Fnr family transcriptional regulator [Cyclobacteriaceae bacterium]